MARYRSSRAGEDIYSDHFAGVWYDQDENLNIGVTNNEGARTRSSEVVYHNRQFSYNFLRRVQNAICNLMPTYSIVGTGVQPQYNRTRISLLSENYIEVVKAYLESRNLLEVEALYFEITKPGELLSNPLHSGGLIGRQEQGGVGYGTLSAKATCNATGRRGIISNHHVTPVGRRIYQHTMGQHLQPHNYIGTSERGWFGGLIDAAFIPFANSSNWQFTSSASFWSYPNREPVHVIPHTYQVASRNEIVVGQLVAKYGQETGISTGRITDVGVSMWVGVPPLWGARFTDQIRTDVYARVGDSGAPVFINSGGSQALAGIVYYRMHLALFT
jgi:hypothetical protein